MLSTASNQIINTWESMSEAAQVQLLTANVKKAAKNEIGYSKRDEYNEYNEIVLWFLHNHGLDGLVNEAYCKLITRLNPEYLDKLNAKRAESGKTNITLISLVYRAAKDAIRKVYRNDIKHGIAKIHTITDKDGIEHSYIDAMAVSLKDNTEKTALTNIVLESLINGWDNIDRLIIIGKRDGYTEREIANAAEISCPAIHKRITKIRATLKKEVA